MAAIPFRYGEYEIIRETAHDTIRTVFLAKKGSLFYHLYYYPIRADQLSARTEHLKKAAAALIAIEHKYLPRFVEYTFGQEPETKPVVKSNAGGHYFAMVQFAREGKYLSEYIAEKTPITLEQWFNGFISALEALDYLHTKLEPICHGRLSPSSVVMMSDAAYLMDFGLCRPVHSGEGTGSAEEDFYRAPEQTSESAATPAADLYALAMTFIAFAGLLNKDYRGKSMTIIESIGPLPEFMRQLLESMIALDPELRPKTTREVLKKIYKYRPSKKHKAQKIIKYGSAAALAVLLILTGWKYGNSLKRGEGEIATLGGWFSGHGNPVSPVTDMLFDDEDLILHRGDVWDAAFHPGGKRLVSLGYKKIIEWDLETRTPVKESKPNNNDIYIYEKPLYFDYARSGSQIYIGTSYAFYVLEAGSLMPAAHYRSTELSRNFCTNCYGHFRAFAETTSGALYAAFFFDSTLVWYNLTANVALTQINNIYWDKIQFSPHGEMMIACNTQYSENRIKGTRITLIPADDPEQIKILIF